MLNYVASGNKLAGRCFNPRLSESVLLCEWMPCKVEDRLLYAQSCWCSRLIPWLVPYLFTKSFLYYPRNPFWFVLRILKIFHNFWISGFQHLLFVLKLFLFQKITVASVISYFLSGMFMLTHGRIHHTWIYSSQPIQWLTVATRSPNFPFVFKFISATKFFNVIFCIFWGVFCILVCMCDFWNLRYLNFFFFFLLCCFFFLIIYLNTAL